MVACCVVYLVCYCLMAVGLCYRASCVYRCWVFVAGCVLLVVDWLLIACALSCLLVWLLGVDCCLLCVECCVLCVGCCSSVLSDVCKLSVLC